MGNIDTPHHIRLSNPVIQVAILLALMLFICLLAKLLQLTGISIEQRFPWTLATTFILFFAAMNAIMCLSSDKLEKYLVKSVFGYIILASVSALLAWLFSGLGIDEAGTYRWLYMVLTFGYLVFLAVIGLMRRIVDYAQNEEWESPKSGKRKPS